MDGSLHSRHVRRNTNGSHVNYLLLSPVLPHRVLVSPSDELRLMLFIRDMTPSLGRRRKRRREERSEMTGLHTAWRTAYLYEVVESMENMASHKSMYEVVFFVIITITIPRWPYSSLSRSLPALPLSVLEAHKDVMLMTMMMVDHLV